ncbi:MAG: pyruvate formate lyase-activating protein [Alphaproteobacteria bacterium]|nr:pyruvate formate lyase-activating protein [Alphaproteobacteria bacterium]
MKTLEQAELRVHSFESGGTVDGPGIRFVVFTQGCPLRCKYCHNPDTWNPKNGKAYPAKTLVNEILKYKTFMTFSKGGVTFSGGEPLVQKESLVPIFEKLKKEGVHIALDTAGTTNIDEVTKRVVELTDLVMLDVKHLDPAGHKNLTGMTNEKCFDFLKLLKEKNVRTWVRWVVVPGVNDTEEYAHQLAAFLKPYDNVELVEILPYHKSGVFKWKELGLNYELNHIKEPSHEIIEELASILESAHIKTLYA